MFKYDDFHTLMDHKENKRIECFKTKLIGMMADMYLRDQEIGMMADRLDSERLRGFVTDRQTDGHTDICDSRVAFATENRFIANQESWTKLL